MFTTPFFNLQLFEKAAAYIISFLKTISFFIFKAKISTVSSYFWFPVSVKVRLAVKISSVALAERVSARERISPWRKRFFIFEQFSDFFQLHTYVF